MICFKNNVTVAVNTHCIESVDKLLFEMYISRVGVPGF